MTNRLGTSTKELSQRLQKPILANSLETLGMAFTSRSLLLTFFAFCLLALGITFFSSLCYHLGFLPLLEGLLQVFWVHVTQLHTQVFDSFNGKDWRSRRTSKTFLHRATNWLCTIIRRCWSLDFFLPHCPQMELSFS